ncbi:MAG: hypothetical protein AAGH15_18805 [Myxococcota bacterium]
MRLACLVAFLIVSGSLGPLTPRAEAQPSESARSRPGSVRFAVRATFFDRSSTRVEDVEFGDSVTTTLTRFEPLSGGLGFQLHYVLSPAFSLGVGPSLSVVRQPVIDGFDETDETFVSYALPLEAEVMRPRGDIRPYFVTGIGVAGDTLSIDGERTTSTGFLLRFGLGLHALAGKRVSVDPEAFFTFRQGTVDLDSIEFQVRNVTFGMSLAFSLWGGDGSREERSRPAPFEEPVSVPAPAPAPTMAAETPARGELPLPRHEGKIELDLGAAGELILMGSPRQDPESTFVAFRRYGERMVLRGCEDLAFVLPDGRRGRINRVVRNARLTDGRVGEQLTGRITVANLEMLATNGVIAVEACRLSAPITGPQRDAMLEFVGHFRTMAAALAEAADADEAVPAETPADSSPAETPAAR